MAHEPLTVTTVLVDVPFTRGGFCGGRTPTMVAGYRRAAISFVS